MFLKKIHLHPIMMLFILLSFITGTFIHLFILFSIVLIHEAGHYAMARYFNWEIHSIMLWVFGGVMKTDESMNRPIKEEIFVTLAGPVQHVFIFFVLIVFQFISFISPDILLMAHYYNIILFIFNLLPIYPLDGGKILLSILSSTIPFKKAYDRTIIFAMFACIAVLIYQIFFFQFTLSAFMLFLFLLWENWQEWKYRHYLFLRFILHRKAHSRHSVINVPGDFKLMDVFHLFRKNYSHSIYIKGINQTVAEANCIEKYMKEKRIHERVDEIWASQG